MFFLSFYFFFFSSRRRHTRCSRDWSSDVCSSDLPHAVGVLVGGAPAPRRDHQSRERSCPAGAGGRRVGLSVPGEGQSTSAAPPGTRSAAGSRHRAGDGGLCLGDRANSSGGLVTAPRPTNEEANKE